MVGIVAEVQRKTTSLDRWCENSYVFQVGGVLFVAFVSEAFFGLRNEECVEVICQWYKKDCRECKLSSKIDCRGLTNMVLEVGRFP